MSNIEVVAIASLFVTCSFPKHPDVMAASDTCQNPAESGVRMPDGWLMWRCRGHRGERWPDGYPHSYSPDASRWGNTEVSVVRKGASR